MVGQSDKSVVFLYTLRTSLALQLILLNLPYYLIVVFSPIKRLLDQIVQIDLHVMAVILRFLIANLQTFKAIAYLLHFIAFLADAFKDAFTS